EATAPPGRCSLSLHAALPIYELDRPSLSFLVYINLQTIYSNLKRFDESYELALQALEFSKRSGSDKNTAHVSINLASQNIEAGKDRKSTRLNSSHVKISYAVF